MDQPASPTPPSPLASTQRTRVLAALGGGAALILIIGLVVWFGTRGDDEITSSTEPSTVPTTSMPTTSPSTAPATTAPPTTAPPTTTPVTTAPATTTPPTTAPPTTPPTTVPPDFELPEPGAPEWTVAIFQAGDVTEMTLRLVTSEGDVAVYDGAAGALRCVAVVGPSDEYTGWCGPAGLAVDFVADRGLSPWLVEVGADDGDVTLAARDSVWALPTNGCTDPMSIILGAVRPEALAVTGLVCADGEAFVALGPLLFGDRRAPDGGGVLVASGDEGWDLLGGPGTSIDCGGWPDGVNRCDLFDVDAELFEAVLPIPPADVQAVGVDIVAMRSATDEVASWTGGETDPALIDAIVVAELVDPTAEVPATVRRAPVEVEGGRLDLLLVEIPLMDDSVATSSYAVWIGALEETAGVRAFTWATCARGVAGPELCI